MLTHEGYSFSLSQWQIGCLLYTLASGEAPFGHEEHIKEAIKVCILKDRLELPYHFSDELKRVVSQLLDKDFRMRTGVEEIIELPFFQSAKFPTRIKPSYYHEGLP